MIKRKRVKGRYNMAFVDFVATHAGAMPQRLAVVDLESGRRWSYAQLHESVDRLAAWLVDGLGKCSGARVATLSKNCAEMLILQLACMRGGAIFVPYNWRLAAAEIEALVQDAQPQMMFCDPEFSAPASVPQTYALSDLLNLGTQGAKPALDARRDFEAVTTLLYTSGTSGRSKGVMLSERNTFWGCQNFISGNDVTMRSVFLCDMPLFHTAGLYAATRVPIHAGATVLISKGFDPEKTLARLSGEGLPDEGMRVSHYFSVPQMAATLWNQPGFDAAKLQHLTGWAIGGAPLPKALTERYVNAGIKITEGFGMSETGSNFGMPTHDLAQIVAKAGSCGKPFFSVEARIVDEAGNDVAVGERGELWMRSPSITSGYWEQPETTAKAFHDDWFITGDAAVRDADGFYYIVDRKKDMYISGGENVYPAEVEAVLAELPYVAEAAIVGVPDARWGEVGRAYVILVPGAETTADALIAHCRARLAKFKVPQTLVITNSIPRTASGKVQKHLLRAQAEREME